MYTSRGNLLWESISKGDMNPVMYDISKMVEYKVQIITFSQKIHNFYTHIYQVKCVRCPNPVFSGQRYRYGMYCAFEDHLLVHVPLLQTKVMIHRGSIFTFSDSLPTVKSNTIFSKITLMLLRNIPLKSRKIWFTSVLAWRDEQQQQHPIPETENIYILLGAFFRNTG